MAWQLAEVGDLYDVGMPDGGGRARFLNEPRRKLSLLRHVGTHHLEGETLVERAMANAVHGSHAALAEHAFHLVATIDDGADERIGIGPIAGRGHQGIA